MSYGMLSHVGISFQNSFGASKTTDMDFFKIINESITENIPPIISEQIQAIFEEGKSFEGLHDISGDIVFDIHPILIGKVIQAWTNAPVSITEPLSGTALYLHKMIPATSDWDDRAAVRPMTIECYRDSGSAHLYYDCLCDGFSIEIAGGALARCTMSVIGGKFAKAIKSVPSYLQEAEYTWDQSSISFTNSAGVSFGIDELSTITISGANSLAGKHMLDGTKTFNRIKRDSPRTMEVAGTILFEGQDEMDKFLDQKEQQMVITLTGQEVTPGYPAILKIDLPSVRYNDYPVNIAGPGQHEVGFSASVKYNVGSANLATFTMQNTQASYAI